jgi:hypothetical protein
VEKRWEVLEYIYLDNITNVFVCEILALELTNTKQQISSEECARQPRSTQSPVSIYNSPRPWDLSFACHGRIEPSEASSDTWLFMLYSVMYHRAHI